MSLSHVSVIIDLMIDPCLTFRKEEYCEIREVLGGAETSAGDGISATLEEIGRLMGVGVGLVVGGLMQLRVFGCSFGWELWRCMVSISDSTLVALVEAPASPVFSSSSSTTTGSSEIRQQKISGTGQKCTRGAHLDCYQLHWVDLSLLFSCTAGMLAKREAV